MSDALRRADVPFPHVAIYTDGQFRYR